MVLNSKVDELQERSQLLQMIKANSPVLGTRMHEYIVNNGKYVIYYTLLRCSTEELCEPELNALDIGSCPFEVQAELRRIIASAQPIEMFLDQKPWLIKLELDTIIRRVRAFLGQTRSGCC